MHPFDESSINFPPSFPPYTSFLLIAPNCLQISTELHTTPRSAVASRKARATSVPPSSGPSRVLAGRPKVAPSIVLVSASTTNTPANTYAYKPIVVSEREAPWYPRSRRRAGSVPPRPISMAVQPASAEYQAIGTEGLKAHNPRLIRHMRATSVGPSASSVAERQGPNEVPRRAASVSRGVPSVGANRHGGTLQRSMIRDVNSRINRLARSMSEPRDFIGPSSPYDSIPEVKQRALNRYLYAHRGRYGADTKPPRSSLSSFPQVYVPKTGPGPSNRAKVIELNDKCYLSLLSILPLFSSNRY